MTDQASHEETAARLRTALGSAVHGGDRPRRGITVNQILEMTSATSTGGCGWSTVWLPGWVSQSMRPFTETAEDHQSGQDHHGGIGGARFICWSPLRAASSRLSR